MITIYLYNKQEMYPEALRKILIEDFRKQAERSRGHDKERYEFIIDALEKGSDTIDINNKLSY